MTQNLILCRNVRIPVEFRSKEYHDTKACDKVKRRY